MYGKGFSVKLKKRGKMVAFEERRKVRRKGGGKGPLKKNGRAAGEQKRMAPSATGRGEISRGRESP